MKSSIRQTGCSRTSGRKFAMALAVASLMSGMFVTPAFADPNDWHGRANPHGHDQRWHDARGWHDYHHPYVYAQPVYVPPAVVVTPQQSPGISLFLPLNFRR